QEPVETVEEEVEEEEEKVKEEPEEESEKPTELEEEPEVKESNNQGDYNVYIGGEIIETDDKIIIHGESNLIPGARVVGEVSVGKNVRYIINTTIKEVDYLADTSEIVEDDGSFYMELDHTNLDEDT